MTGHCWRTFFLAAGLTVIGGVAGFAQDQPPPDAQAPQAPGGASAPGNAASVPNAAPQAPAAPIAQPVSASGNDQGPAVTPIRLGMTYGNVSFWRPGAEDWTQARSNTPLAPGDSLYTEPHAALELQSGPQAFLRASGDTQLSLENQEPDYRQLKVASGHLSADLRRLKAGEVVEIDTPNAAFTVGTGGYYRVDVTDDMTTFVTRRGGRAMMTPASGDALGIAPSEEVVVRGGDTPSVETYAAPAMDAWDRWNYARSEHLIDPASARYVSPGVYGADDLDHYGTWRVTRDYGPLWVPSSVPPGWAPYSAGRWIWDPVYGWTWVDDAPWGWAPFHYGRWVYANPYWGWAPGPPIAVSIYAPALVAFFGGPHFGVSIGIGAPAVGWVALGWGEPLLPWWGGPQFVGRPWWGGWGGPRVVNNVVINRTTIVNANTINVYRNAGVRNAVLALRQDQFGRGAGARARVAGVDPRHLEPMQGRLPVQPVSASLSPNLTRAGRPPAPVLNRSVVATRAPHDAAAPLRAAGLQSTQKPGPAPHLVSAPTGKHPAYAAARPPFGQQGTLQRQPPPPPRFGQTHQPNPRNFGRAVSPPQSRQLATQPSAPVAGAGQHGGFTGAPPPRSARGPQPGAAPSVMAPRQGAPSISAPANPHVSRRMAAPRALPGEPANRVYQPQAVARSPQFKVPAQRRAPAAPHTVMNAAPRGAVPQTAPRSAPHGRTSLSGRRSVQ